MDTFFSLISVTSVTWRDILDICLVTVLMYNIIVMVKQTRAVTAIYGLLFVILSYFLVRLLGLNTLTWILEAFLGSLFLIVVIVFQGDIKHALTTIGARNWWSLFSRRKTQINPHLAILCDAVEYMAQRKIGALIVLERKVPLGEIMERGVSIDAKISKELLVNLFWPNSPMHDGAVIIRGNKVAAGGCILPLSTAATKRDYGTRHRAALGITEVSDAIAIAVSEERGVVSISVGGRLTGTLEGPKLLHVLTSAMEKTI